MLAAVILAAGESRRMGSPKATLPFPVGEATPGKITFLDHLISVVRRPRIGLLRVVLGANAEKIQQRVRLKPDWVVFNAAWQKGQLSSIQAALASLPEGGTDGVLVCPVDTPLISTALVDTLIQQFYASRRPVVLPTYRGTRGHPVIFSAALYPDLLAASHQTGARAVVWAHSADVQEVETEEEGVILNLNDPDTLKNAAQL
jgi:molybdenum cofactor cytidylyltransferase